MDNGAEVFAKLPNPNAGPSQFTTASEVATHELVRWLFVSSFFETVLLKLGKLRDVFNIPVPRILAWSSDAASNPVGAEYIISEKAPGTRLGSVWGEWPREAKLKLVAQIVDMENKLTTISFPRHGCIYFKDDLRALTGKSEEGINVDSPDDASLSRFSIGPLTSAELWEGSRGGMKLDRGPCKSAS